jgi:flagellar motility protein MotE (MotC chaperone)
MRRIDGRVSVAAALVLGVLCVAPVAARAADAAAGPDPALEAIVSEANQEREAAIQERERRVTEGEARLAAMRDEVTALIAQNETLRADLAERAKAVGQAENERVARLIKVYEAMEPEEAAAILDGMAEPVALQVFGGMKDRAAAGIMGFMPKAKAARLGERLAHPR